MESADLPIADLPALKNGFITLGCLCNFCKVSDASLSLWAKVLREIPESRLLMMAPQGSSRQGVIQKLQGEGINPNRLEFVSRQSRREYLKTLQRIDLGLDTLPYNGHTTSLDSFWMGTPVVTLIGQTIVGRAGVEHAVQLRSEGIGREFHRGVRSHRSRSGKGTNIASPICISPCGKKMQNSPLCDGQRFARNVEAVYRQQWRHWCAGQTP